MRGRRSARFLSALLLSALALAAQAAAGSAATREPLRELLAAARHPAQAFDSVARPRPAALRAMVRQATRATSSEDRFEISSTFYGAAEVESVAATLRSLDHGPELAQLAVYVATPEEIDEACGADVVACYIPSERQMVVSGDDRPVAGIPRDFAIAHEYGHHIANMQRGDDHIDVGGALAASIEAGTLRWATYERVCQLTRRGRLWVGDQGAHYWQNPEEAFAQSYAQLNRPGAGIGWQYTPLLQPSTASLAKIHADVDRPWSGPVEASWAGSVTAPPAAQPSRAETRTGSVAVGSGHAVGDLPWVASRALATPLDGPVSVTLRAPAGTQLVLTLRDPAGGRALARALTAADGSAQLSYSNCGHEALRLEVRAIAGGASFQAAIARP